MGHLTETINQKFGKYLIYLQINKFHKPKISKFVNNLLENQNNFLTLSVL